mmetsp:Transcript_22594/g.53342  ORF Transcript_22594/g.53342 Transcript_22594/m.53342 type:complete len:162 (-) Transcript_22594:100-585(-)
METQTRVSSSSRFDSTMTQLLAAASITMGISSTQVTMDLSAEPNHWIDEPSSSEILEIWSNVLGIRDSFTLDSSKKCQASERQDTGSTQTDLACYEEDEAWWLANEQAGEGAPPKSESSQRRCQAQAARASSESSMTDKVPAKIFDGPVYYEKSTKRRREI